MDIAIGQKLRFVPAGWSDGGPNALPAFMKADVVGTVVDLSEERQMFRVEYEAKGTRCFECFKLPKIVSDKWQLVKKK